MIKSNYTELILQGIKEGDQIGGPYELAKIFSQHLHTNNGFKEDDLRIKYLSWWKEGAFDTGPTYASVFNKIENGMDPLLAAEKVHEEFGFNTAGCGPTHRATPLAGIMVEKFKLKKGDEVIVLTGKDKGKTGKIVKMIPKQMKAIVSEINRVKKNQKPDNNQPGGIIDKEMPIHISNLAFFDRQQNKGIKVGYKIIDNKKVRISRLSGKEI